MECETPFWKNPAELMKMPNFKAFFSQCMENRYNVFFSIILVIFIIGLFFDVWSGDFTMESFMENIIGIAVIGLVMVLMYVFMNKNKSESFADLSPVEEPVILVSRPGTVVPLETMPTPSNPFMNVLVHEVKYNPTRAAAAPVDCPAVKETLENFFRVQWWSDPTDIYGKNQDQRQFYTMPSTSIPNDQQSFQDWLFKIPGKTCKEGNRAACNPGTNGGAIPWLSQPN